MNLQALPFRIILEITNYVMISLNSYFDHMFFGRLSKKVEKEISLLPYGRFKLDSSRSTMRIFSCFEIPFNCSYRLSMLVCAMLPLQNVFAYKGLCIYEQMSHMESLQRASLYLGSKYDGHWPAEISMPYNSIEHLTLSSQHERLLNLAISRLFLCYKLKKLRISFSSWIAAYSLDLFMLEVPTLRYLHVTNVNFTHRAPRSAARRELPCRTITKVKFSFCVITGDFLRILANSEKLETVILENLTLQCPNEFYCFCQYWCKSLKHLELRNVPEEIAVMDNSLSEGYDPITLETLTVGHCMKYTIPFRFSRFPRSIACLTRLKMVIIGRFGIESSTIEKDILRMAKQRCYLTKTRLDVKMSKSKAIQMNPESIRRLADMNIRILINSSDK